MKKLVFVLLSVISISASAQKYSDSLITLQLTQRAAWYVGHHIKTGAVWSDRTAPGVLKDYVGNGNKPDSLFYVTLKAGYIKGMIELLIGGQNEVVQADRLSIINNSPAIPSYTSLSTQIVNLANGNSSQKQVAIFIRDYYLQRLAELAALRLENKNAVINWSNN